jgi:uncharacterized protein (TIGR00661 family)
MPNKKLKFLFVVQGEGRGHMTQAISLEKMFIAAGHEVCKVLIGKSDEKDVPDFVLKNMQAPVESFRTPYFLKKDNKGILIGPTIIHNLINQKTYFKSIDLIHQNVQKYQPDVVINFYELLCGLFFALKRPKNVKHVCIAHQFFLEHPDFHYPPNSFIDQFFLRNNTSVTWARKDLVLALSFREIRNYPPKKIVVVPPLLRSEVKVLESENHGHILAYMVNSGYGDDIIEWHKTHRDVKIHAFWDRKDAPEELHVHENLTLHRLNGVKFLEYMRTCKGYVSTAGFESICEAMYLGKPIMMIPTDNHFEQRCNSIDGKESGAGIVHNKFEFEPLLAYIPNYKDQAQTFRKWEAQAPERILKAIEGLF